MSSHQTHSPGPAISVIVLNFNGRAHLETCLPSLEALDYPASHVELLVVDNGSTDGSAEFVRTQHPRVRVHALAKNTGFAAGNNAGAAVATGEWLVFLNNDMRVDAGFLHALSEASAAAPEVACFGAKILSWNGKTIDFADSGGHFAGYAYQIGNGDPAESPAAQIVKPLLFACGGAMMIRRNVFLETGGFDEDYFAYLEDFDLGWRLWTLGHQVMFCPQAVAFHRGHGTSGKMGAYRRDAVQARNAIYSVIKNYSDANLGKVLPAALFGAIAGVVERGRLSGKAVPADYELGAQLAPSNGPVPLDKSAFATLAGIAQAAAHLPKVFKKRAEIQQKRKRDDADILPLFKRPFAFWPAVPASRHYQLAESFGIQSLFTGTPRKIMVVASDILPLPGLPTVGSGLRAWGVGQALIGRGHEVVFSMPRAALAKQSTPVSDEVAALAWEHHTIHHIISKVQPDAIVICNWPLMHLLHRPLVRVPVILDQHGPHLLERQFQAFGDAETNRKEKLSALSMADFFTCAGDLQLAYFQDWLKDAGWSDAERAERAAAFPVSLDPQTPDRTFEPTGDPTFVYGGVFLPWQDPSLGLNTLVEAMTQRQRGKLLFFGGRHPVYPVDPGKYESILAAISNSPYVEAPGMVPHDALIERYCRANVALDLMARNAERELAFTTRTVEYLWCGLPVIYNDYAELARYIRDYDAGWTVDPTDKAALERVFAEIYEHPERVAERGRNAQRLARERLAWDVTSGQLDQFVRFPRMREHEMSLAPRMMLSTRTMRYLALEARRHLQRSGPRGLFREGKAFIQRQIRR
jgi:GT2 family glycosyltransferase/glycosyltransferase involved in cell wall biosynthesis